ALHHVLDLGGVDVTAALDDHVLHAVVDEEIAVAQIARVAAAEPAAPVGAAAFREALRGGLGVAPVALHVLRAANPDLADLAVGQIAATLRVDDPQLGVAPRLTRGAQQLCARAARVVIALHERHHAARGLGE